MIEQQGEVCRFSVEIKRHDGVLEWFLVCYTGSFLTGALYFGPDRQRSIDLYLAGVQVDSERRK